MKTRLTLSERLEQMPFLRMLIPLIIGVVAADYLSVPTHLLIGALTLSLGAVLVFRGERLRLTLMTVMIFLMGLTAAKVLNPYEEMPRDERLVLTGEITDNVTTRGRWHRTTARITAFRSYDDSTAAWQSCK